VLGWRVQPQLVLRIAGLLKGAGIRGWSTSRLLYKGRVGHDE
jgi:hypothetical protein